MLALDQGGAEARRAIRGYISCGEYIVLMSADINVSIWSEEDRNRVYHEVAGWAGNVPGNAQLS
jgi:hypothetical protein